MLLCMLISYPCQLFCCGGAAWGRPPFISVTTSSWCLNDPKTVGADVMTPNPMAVLLSRNLNMHFINDARLRAVHLGNPDLALPRELLQTFLLLLVFMQEAQICCCQFLSVSSLCQTGLLSLWCWLIGQQWWGWGNKSSNSLLAKMSDKRNTRRLLLQRRLFVPSSSAFLKPLLLCAESPRESCKEEYGLAAMGCEELLSAWQQDGIHLAQAETSLVTIHRENFQNFTGNDQFYSNCANDTPEPVCHIGCGYPVEMLNRKERSS